MEICFLWPKTTSYFSFLERTFCIWMIYWLLPWFLSVSMSLFIIRMFFNLEHICLLFFIRKINVEGKAQGSREAAVIVTAVVLCSPLTSRLIGSPRDMVGDYITPLPPLVIFCLSKNPVKDLLVLWSLEILAWIIDSGLCSHERCQEEITWAIMNESMLCRQSNNTLVSLLLQLLVLLILILHNWKN